MDTVKLLLKAALPASLQQLTVRTSSLLGTTLLQKTTCKRSRASALPSLSVWGMLPLLSSYVQIAQATRIFNKQRSDLTISDAGGANARQSFQSRATSIRTVLLPVLINELIPKDRDEFETSALVR